MINPVLVKDLATQNYENSFANLIGFTRGRDSNTLDEIWMLQHHPVFTQGQAGKPEHILVQSSIPVVQSDRGGQVTYHGPGQLIVYFLIDLNRKKMPLRTFIDSMEQSIIELLHNFGIKGATNPKAPGIYVNGAKICSLGLRVRKGCTYHGLSLNVDMNLEPFSQINPCGFAGMKMTQIKDFSPNATVDSAATQLLPILLKNLQLESATT